MPIASTDIHYRLSGGAANSDVNASLGGAKSSTQITSASLHNLFDLVTAAESSPGDTEYRGIYVHNNHGTLTLQSTVVWVQTETPSSGTQMDLALAGEGLNGTMETVADESTAPVGETFSHPTTKAGGLSMGNIPAGQHYGLWIRRVVSASTGAASADAGILRVEGDTAA